jgi:SPP1 gp7 family putative phage head morphogenesis protein
MTDIASKQEVQAAARRRFRGNKTLHSRVVTTYPENLEREYMRITNTYMMTLNRVIKARLPRIWKAINEQYGIRLDSDADFQAWLENEFIAISQEFERMALSFGLDRQLTNLGNLTRKLSISEWRRVVHATIGINILDDYYMGEFYRQQLTLWTQNNIGLIRTIPQNTLDNMQGIIQDGYIAGARPSTIARDIQAAYGIERRHAQFIARDQIAKLNADITQAQQKDAGVEEYVWRAPRDSRTRECHAEFNGQRFKWSDPPDNWYDTQRYGRRYTGRYHPGEAPNCRCVALPIFNLPGLDLPWDKGKETEQ